MNKVFLKGNLTRDPEVKFTPKGTAICNFGIATNRVWINDQNEKMEEVTFVDITAWGRTAETIGDMFRKGRPILIEGRLKLDQWDDKQTGQKRSKLNVQLEHFEFCDSKPADKSSTSHEKADRGSRQRRPDPPSDPDLDQPDEDIPF